MRYSIRTKKHKKYAIRARYRSFLRIFYAKSKKEPEKIRPGLFLLCKTGRNKRVESINCLILVLTVCDDTDICAARYTE